MNNVADDFDFDDDDVLTEADRIELAKLDALRESDDIAEDEKLDADFEAELQEDRERFDLADDLDAEGMPDVAEFFRADIETL